MCAQSPESEFASVERLSKEQNMKGLEPVLGPGVSKPRSPELLPTMSLSLVPSISLSERDHRSMVEETQGDAAAAAAEVQNLVNRLGASRLPLGSTSCAPPCLRPWARARRRGCLVAS